MALLESGEAIADLGAQSTPERLVPGALLRVGNDVGLQLGELLELAEVSRACVGGHNLLPLCSEARRSGCRSGGHAETVFDGSATTRGMYLKEQVLGKGLKPMQLCLTYDDGPGATHGSASGPRTLELAEYLRDQGIVATFFVLGKHVDQHADVLKGVHAAGHLIGNHTYDHCDLQKRRRATLPLLEEISRADEAIRKAICCSTRYFRPPGGAWDDEVAKALCAEEDQARTNGASGRQHIGAVGWDVEIPGGDYGYWKDGKTPEECARAFLDAIEERPEKSRGAIVLMHDSNNEDDLRPKNRTYEMTQKLVPLLGAAGYEFVPLNEIPEVKRRLAAIA